MQFHASTLFSSESFILFFQTWNMISEVAEIVPQDCLGVCVSFLQYRNTDFCLLTTEKPADKSRCTRAPEHEKQTRNARIPRLIQTIFGANMHEPIAPSQAAILCLERLKETNSKFCFLWLDRRNHCHIEWVSRKLQLYRWVPFNSNKLNLNSWLIRKKSWSMCSCLSCIKS